MIIRQLLIKYRVVPPSSQEELLTCQTFRIASMLVCPDGTEASKEWLKHCLPYGVEENSIEFEVLAEQQICNIMHFLAPEYSLWIAHNSVTEEVYQEILSHYRRSTPTSRRLE